MLSGRAYPLFTFFAQRGSGARCPAKGYRHVPPSSATRGCCRARNTTGRQRWFSGGIESTCFRMRRLKDFTNCVTSARMSPASLGAMAARPGRRSDDNTDRSEIARELPS